MNGIETYESNYDRKVDVLLKNNRDLKELRGFYNYISDLSKATSYIYLNRVKKFLKETNKNVSELSLDDYSSYMNSIKNRTVSFQINVYSALKRFSFYLQISKQNSSNPMQYIKKPKFSETIETVVKRENGFLTEKEIKKYLDNVRSSKNSFRTRDLAMVMIFLNTGMRCSALYKLDVDNIDFESNKLITIDKGSKIQEYYLNDGLISVIKDWLTDRESLVGKSERALFISSYKERLTQNAIYRIINKYASNIDGKHITPHKLRATYGTELYKKTKDVYFVQQCMGHSSPKTTEKYIRGEKATARAKAADIMGSVTKI